MITRPQNWENVQAFSDRPKLPVGAYVCKVKQVGVQNTDYGQQLCILFDIAEGEFTGYYNNDYTTSTLKNKKWKGVLKQFLPIEDGSEKDMWTKRGLKGLITSFENSNPGYTWNWDEKTLVGKMIGIIMRNEEWAYQGKQGWAVRPFRVTSVETVRSGKFTMPKDKPLSGNSNLNSNVPPSDVNGFVQVDDEELPWA